HVVGQTLGRIPGRRRPRGSRLRRPRLPDRRRVARLPPHLPPPPRRVPSPAPPSPPPCRRACHGIPVLCRSCVPRRRPEPAGRVCPTLTRRSAVPRGHGVRRTA